MTLVVPSDPLAAPTWLTAIFTIVLAVGAIVTAAFAILAFRKQSAALAKLTAQADDQVETNKKLREAADKQVAEINASLDRLKEENEARRRAQATKVFLWTTPASAGNPIGWAAAVAKPVPKTVAHVRNASDRPVYQLKLAWKIGAATLPPPSQIATLLPGEEKTEDRDTHPGAEFDPFGPDLHFTDADGVRWLLTSRRRAQRA
jgi:hypothetical protein